MTIPALQPWWCVLLLVVGFCCLFFYLFHKVIVRASPNGPEIITAHVGDTRAMMRVDGKVVSLTIDHDLKDKAERDRVEKRGGVVEMYFRHFSFFCS